MDAFSISGDQSIRSTNSMNGTASWSEKKSLVLIEAAPSESTPHAAALERAGFDVTALGAGDRLLEAVGRERPAVVVLDLAAGGADPFGLLAAVHALEPPVAVIATTADGSLNIAIKADRAGARDCLVKPFRPERLVDAVRRALGPDPLERAPETRPAPAVRRALGPDTPEQALAARRAPAAAGREADGFVGSSPQMRA